jgi:glycosyltransferase involved in cell wall biosynthesis
LAFLRIRNYCLAHQIDIIHTHCGKSHAFAYWLKTLFLPKVLLVCHRRIPARIRNSLISRQKFHGSAVNHFITVSDYIKSILEDGGVDSHRITTVRSSKKPFPCDDETKSHARAELSTMKRLAPGGKFFVVAACRLVEDKGLFVLIEAFGKLVREHADARLILAGEGPLEKDLRVTGSQLLESGHMIMPGFQKDVPRLLLGCDVFAIPSLSEGLGSAIIEAMMARTTVVGTCVEGIPELIRHGQTGILVKPRDSAQLFEALQELATDPEVRNKLADAGYQWSIGSCNSALMVEKTQAVYLSLLKPPPTKKATS